MNQYWLNTEHLTVANQFPWQHIIQRANVKPTFIVQRQHSAYHPILFQRLSDAAFPAGLL